MRACRDYFRSVRDGTHNFDAARPPNFQDFAHHEWPVGRISLNLVNIECAGDFTVTKSAPIPYFQFNFLLEGQCEIRGRHGSVVANPGDTFVVDPEQSATEFWHNRSTQYLLRIDRRVVEQALANELGTGLTRPLVFESVTRDPGIGNWLRHIADSGLNTAGLTLLRDHRVVKGMEDTLVAMLLSGLRHSETDSLARRNATVAPYYVKRAEEFIDAHARDDLSIEEISAASRVSPRTLFYGFKRWRGKSPMAYVRDARLDIARRELQQGQRDGGTVSRAAINSGFSNFSQFSRIYKARFGETPSATLLGR